MCIKYIYKDFTLSFVYICMLSESANSAVISTSLSLSLEKFLGKPVEKEEGAGQHLVELINIAITNQKTIPKFQ